VLVNQISKLVHGIAALLGRPLAPFPVKGSASCGYCFVYVGRRCDLNSIGYKRFVVR
jgi:hypothetical protein